MDMNLENLILNMDKIHNLSESNKQIVMNLFYKLVDCFSGDIGQSMVGGGIRVDVVTAKLIHDTLVEHEYLITRRDKRIDEILQ